MTKSSTTIVIHSRDNEGVDIAHKIIVSDDNEKA